MHRRRRRKTRRRPNPVLMFLLECVAKKAIGAALFAVWRSRKTVGAALASVWEEIRDYFL